MCSCLLFTFYFFFFKQKTAYEMRISDWSSDVCSSDLIEHEDLTGTGAEDVSVAAVESGDLYAAFGHGGFRLVPGQRAARQLSAGYHVRRLTKIGRASCRERGCQYV